MLRACLFVALVVAGCTKDTADAKGSSAKKEAPVTAGTVKDGVRRVEITANQEGYVPGRIVGKPGEKLVLAFKRTIEGECLAQLKTPDGKVIELPMNKVVDVPVTVPATGELAFACGMDMFKGTIVAEASK